MRDAIGNRTAMRSEYRLRRPLAGAQGEDGEVLEQKPGVDNRLDAAWKNAAAAFSAYTDFRARHKVQRAASYPDSHIMHFSILAALVLFEGLANAYFFSKGSDLGLLGGWIQAITVAFTNVIAAFFLVGFLGLRLLQNPVSRPFSFWAAVVGVPLALAFIVFLNFSAAHYRDLLEVQAAMMTMNGEFAPNGEVLTPVTRALTFQPFETLEALLLFILGITFAAIAAFKGATFDDSLIGYGAVQRRVVAASAHLSELMKRQYRKDDADEVTLAKAEELKERMDEFFARDYEHSAARYDAMASRRSNGAGGADAGYDPAYDHEPPPYARS
ncbi:MAG: hypothetical protein JJU18_04085 [Oceanicaulis sp.]|nr:hypothetical protein [Oceanicaulis sp.]